MAPDICKMGNIYGRLLKISAIEEAGLNLEQYLEVVEQIGEWEGNEFKIPKSLQYSKDDDKMPKLSYKYRERTLLLNATLMNLTKDAKQKRELLEDSRVLNESLLGFVLCGGDLTNSGFPLCDYLQNKYIGGIA